VLLDGRNTAIRRSSARLARGCADILFSRSAGKTDLKVAGTMSRYADFQLPPGQILMGVRFHPGMSPPFLRAPANELADKTVPLEDLWGRPARGLREELANSSTIPDAIAAFERYLQPPEMNAREIAMWAWLRQRGGEARLDELARLSGLGIRQLRRVCLTQTGLTPKRMSRVLRLRRASSLGRGGMDWAAVAAQCGYYDQAHLIRDFRELSGRTPGGRF